MPRTATPTRTLVTIHQAADMLGVHHRTVRRYVSDGLLPGFKIGPSLIRVDQSDVDNLLRRIPTVGGRA